MFKKYLSLTFPKLKIMYIPLKRFVCTLYFLELFNIKQLKKTNLHSFKDLKIRTYILCGLAFLKKNKHRCFIWKYHRKITIRSICSAARMIKDSDSKWIKKLIVVPHIFYFLLRLISIVNVSHFQIGICTGNTCFDAPWVKISQKQKLQLYCSHPPPLKWLPLFQTSLSDLHYKCITFI